MDIIDRDTFRRDFRELAFLLLEPHAKMPKMALTRNETKDIAAYIGTLAQ